MDMVELLLRYNIIKIQKGSRELSDEIFPPLATILSNLYYYGYAPSGAVFDILKTLTKEELALLWSEIDPILRDITLDDREIDRFVVYQNFPEEVLKFSEAEYWYRQILIYLGVNKDHLREPKKSRQLLIFNDIKSVLQLASDRSVATIVNSLLSKTTRWTPAEITQVQFLVDISSISDLTGIPFKENLVTIGIEFLKQGKSFDLQSTTDLLRLIIGVSGGDISLTENSKIKSFPRSQRRIFLNQLENMTDLEEGVMRHPKKWIKVLHSLHIGDYKDKFPKVFQVAVTLRSGGRFPTFYSRLEAGFADRDPRILNILKTRPGEFARRLFHTIKIFQDEAVAVFIEVLPQLPTLRLLQLKKVIELYPDRQYRFIAPKGSWSKVQYFEYTDKPTINQSSLDRVSQAIRSEVLERLTYRDIFYEEALKKVKLPSNTKDAILPYGRGTIFDIPPEIKFIRTATYWEAPNHGTVWFDNGWNFFSEEWKAIGTCCWDHADQMKPGAVFSGDPVSGDNIAGQATQLIDLYPDTLKTQNVRFAVWNILCYSRVPFEGVKEVLGLLEMGYEPQTGRLIEPSRATFAFPVTGNSFTKYVCVLDIEKRQLIYLDAPLRGSVSSAKRNENRLEGMMPAMMEYLESLPSVFDLFESLQSNPSADRRMLYSDEEIEVTQGYVFQQVNTSNVFENLTVDQLYREK